MSIVASFDGRRVLVTGGANGIGLAIAKKFLESGASVIVLDNDKNQLEALKRDHPSVTTVTADLLDWEGTRTIIEQLGPIHHLVNNAGIARPPELLMDIKPESIDKIFNVNFKSMVNVTQAVAKGMIEAKLENPTIVNLSSISDTVAVGGLSMYSCSKAAISMLTKCSALELGVHGIRVNCVRPAMVKTEHVGRLVTVEGGPPKSEIFQNVLNVNERKVFKRLVEMSEVADSVLFLSSSASSMTTGSDILLDGGLFTC